MNFFVGSVIAGLAVAALGAGAVVRVTHAQEPSRREADAMATKLERVEAAAEQQRPARARPLRTTFTEREINSYVALEGPEFLPAGVTMLRVRLDDDGRVQARAVVDLNEVRRSRDRGVFDPLAYLRGRVEVEAAGEVEGSDGEGLIRYESATVGGVTVPKVVAQELLQFYSRTPKRPRGFAFDEPFALPAGMRAVGVKRGSVTVTQ